MTLQEIFDIVARHLLTQRERSVYVDAIGNENCAYRGNDGLKCAIGCLIPDEKYSYDLEGKTADSDPVKIVLSEIGIDSTSFCYSLQNVHDSVDPTDWPYALRDLAKEHDILYAIVDEMESAK